MKGLMANRNKGQTLKEAPKTQVTPKLPPSPPVPSANLKLKVVQDLRKERPIEGLEECELEPAKGAKQQKRAKDPKTRGLSQWRAGMRSRRARGSAPRLLG